MNAASKCASCASSPSDSPRFRWTSPRSGSSRPAAILSSVVLPPPFGPTRPIRSPSAIAASMRSRITNVADLADHAGRRRIDISRRPPSVRRPAGLLQRVGFAPSAPSVSTVPCPPASRSVQRRPRRPGPPVMVLRIARGPRDRRPAGAGTTSRNASTAHRARSAGSVARSAGTARRCAGRPARRSCIEPSPSGAV